MATFNTLRTITEDLLKIIRGSKISESEVISRRQLEDWIHQYRALLISRDLEKGYDPNPDYIQSTGALALVVDGTEKVIDTELPRVIDMNRKSGFSYVGDANGCEIQMIPEHRKCWQQYKRYTPTETLWYLGSNDGKLHFINADDITEVVISGIFENPGDIDRLAGGSFDLNSRYPIPNNLVPTLKEMILQKELNVEAQAPSDNKNDSNLEVAEKVENQYRV